MKRKHCIPGLLLMMVLMLAGCSRTPQVDHFYGTSYSFAKQSQLADPKAGIGQQPIQGMEGTIGSTVMERYKAGFVQPAPKVESYSLNVAGMTKK